MTDCCRQLTFSFYQHKQLIADFKGGQISSDTGLLAVRQLDEKLGWLAQAASLISDPRRRDRTELDVLALLRQRVFGLIGGYEDCNDHDRLRTDPVLKLTCDRGPQDDPLASQPTLSRFENWPSAREVARLNRLLVEHYIALYRHQGPWEIILDVDPTDDPCHGAQQLALFNGFYDQYMYLPLLVFDRASGMLLGVRLRAGNVHPARGVVPLLKPIVSVLKEAFPRTRIIVRADAGFAVPRLYEFCEKRGIQYLVGIPSKEAFKAHSEPDLQRLCQRFAHTTQHCRYVAGFWHQAGTWDKKRRIIYKVEVNAEGTNRRYLVSNMKGLPVHLWRLYCDRGTAEGFIEQLKNALKADRLSCHRFVANAFRLAQFALAYNLLRVFASKLCGTILEGASIETIRTRLLKVGARLEESVRRVWVHIAGGFPLREVLALVLERIGRMPARAAPCPA
jgi:Transposase DDE domain group 1